jgi:ribonuclease HI
VISRTGTAAVVAAGQAKHILRTVAASADGAYPTSYTDQGKLDHPWIAEKIAELQAALLSGRARLCSHLSRKPRVAMAMAHDPTRLRCEACLATMPRLSEVENMTCDRCRRYTRGLRCSVAGIGGILLFFGLCQRCCDETGFGDEGFAASPDQPAQRGESRRSNPPTKGENEMDIEIHTDGVCVPDPGPGGWGVVLRCGRHVKELSGGTAEQTTSNRMELTAAIEGLSALLRPSVVTVYADSRYVVDGMSRHLSGWRARGWVLSSGDPVKNVDLWKRLEAAAQPHQVTWQWVKGHAGNPGNEWADQLALIGLRTARAQASATVAA